MRQLVCQAFTAIWEHKLRNLYNANGQLSPYVVNVGLKKLILNSPWLVWNFLNFSFRIEGTFLKLAGRGTYTQMESIEKERWFSKW